MSSSPLLSLRGIGKRFPGVVALDNVSLEIGAGEVVALCGENGAGKSTLMKIVGGVYQPDDGEIVVAGAPVKINHVNDSMRLGVAFIHQELNVLDNLDVAANVYLGREPKNALGLIDFKKIHADTEPFLKRLGLNISSRTTLEKLSIAEKQMVEIAKALSLNSRIIIMDEPTSSLTLQETDRLLELVLELKKQGVSIVYISHRLSEVEHIADRVVVLRDGKNAGGLNRADIKHDNIVSLMVGREIKGAYVGSNAAKTPGYFKVRNARSSRYPGKSVEFDATRGEILGIAGLVGAGRSEIVKAMVGLDPHGSAEVTIGLERISINKPADAIGHGIYLVPEDRRGEGLVTAMTVRENTTLPSLEKYSTFNLINKDRERKVTDEQIKSLKIKTPHGEALVLNLSGGNQQKVVLGKWLSMSPKVMILDEPTRGIDVGAKAEIYRLMRELADGGGVILMISSDMEEVLNVSDRVTVMHEGRITGVLERADCNEENVMNLAVGKTIAAAKAAVN
ncbi:MAG: sugar ABC transporter ATP-binding protein [Verrucomicrobiota bacterium]